MKIGEVAKKYHLSVDHIRYYIQLGLLVPHKKNTQYRFTNKDLDELHYILQLKNLQFTLKEIHHIVSIKRVSHLVDQKDIMELINLHEIQKAKLLTEKALLEGTIQQLDKEILALRLQMETPTQGPSKTGVPLDALSLLYCPHCQKPLHLTNGDMDHRYIYKGHLYCTDCSYQGDIEDGIIITPNRNTSAYDQPDLEREFYMNIPPELVTLFQKSYNWMLRHVDLNDLKDKVILETHINAYFFLHKHWTDLNADCLYIVVDKFPEMISMYKQRIEHLGLQYKILYIADNSVDYPLRHGCVDLFVDYFSSNEHGFYHHDYLIQQLLRYFKDNSRLLGTYFHFDPLATSVKHLCDKYPEAFNKNFNLPYFLDCFKKTPFTMSDQRQIGYVTKTGDSRAFSFHDDGEPMYMFSYYAGKMDG